jgi:hypothetical protein
VGSLPFNKPIGLHCLLSAEFFFLIILLRMNSLETNNYTESVLVHLAEYRGGTCPCLTVHFLWFSSQMFGWLWNFLGAAVLDCFVVTICGCPLGIPELMFYHHFVSPQWRNLSLRDSIATVLSHIYILCCSSWPAAAMKIGHTLLIQYDHAYFHSLWICQSGNLFRLRPRVCPSEMPTFRYIYIITR